MVVQLALYIYAWGAWKTLKRDHSHSAVNPPAITSAGRISISNRPAQSVYFVSLFTLCFDVMPAVMTHMRGNASHQGSGEARQLLETFRLAVES